MKVHAYIVNILVLYILISQAGLTAASTVGTFNATMGDEIYDMDVTCDKFSKNKVMFRSDDDDSVYFSYNKPIDTNGDNITVYGQPLLGDGLTLNLTIYVKGEFFVGKSSYEGNKKLDLKMSGNTLTGKGEMLGSGYINPIIEFTLTCQ